MQMGDHRLGFVIILSKEIKNDILKHNSSKHTRNIYSQSYV
jgi:hypothetical protein